MFRVPSLQQLSRAAFQPGYLHIKGNSRTSGILHVHRSFAMSAPLQEGAIPKHRTRKRLIILCDGAYEMRYLVAK
jgi:hypothetical protein